MDSDTARSAIGSLLLATASPLKLKELMATTGLPETVVVSILNDISGDIESLNMGMQVIRVAGGYQLATVPENSYYVAKLQHLSDRGQLSEAAMEALAIVCYRQPVTRAEVEGVRGVQCGTVLANLVERGLIKEVGRKETVGRPILFGTTELFLRAFGINSLDDLPSIEDADRQLTLFDGSDEG